MFKINNFDRLLSKRVYHAMDGAKLIQSMGFGLTQTICARIPYNKHYIYGSHVRRGNSNDACKKTIELDQEQINRIKTALRAKSEKEAINSVLQQFDTDLQLEEVTLNKAGSFEFEEF